MKVFVAGPRALKSLSAPVKERFAKMINQNIAFLVGDASGIDKMTQQYFYDAAYKNVTVYASNGVARNNVGKWAVRNVPVKEAVSGFDFYAAKDKMMADEADYGFMIWNGKSKGTLNNIINLTKQDKAVLIYFTPHRKFYSIKGVEKAEQLAFACGADIGQLFNRLCGIQTKPKQAAAAAEQTTLYHTSL
jgi:hypothetical protein